MAFLDRRATLHGIDGVIVGAAPSGVVWQAELPADRVLAFLRDGAEGVTLELRSEAGVTHARVLRCWVDVVPPGLRLRVALAAHAVA